MKLLSTFLIIGISFFLGCTEKSGQDEKTVQQDDNAVSYMLVQNSEDVELVDSTLILIGVSPTTIYFSDRPERIAGHIYTEDLIDIWSEGEDDFADDPPNATLSIFGEDEIVDLVVELKNPRIEDDNFLYDIVLLDGEIPDFGGQTTLFIDVVGAPLTPVSVAGVARRARRREVRREIY